MKQKLATGSYSRPQHQGWGTMDDLTKSPGGKAQKELLSVPSVSWSTPKNDCQHMPSWDNISSKAPWCMPVVHASPSHVSMSSLARKSHGRPSLQTHRVWVRSQTAVTSCGDDKSSPHQPVWFWHPHLPTPTTILDTCSYTATQNLTLPQSQEFVPLLRLCPHHSWPSCILIPTNPACLVFRSCSLRIPGRRSRFTGSTWGAAECQG